jgi:hypothetical protein
MPAHVAEKLLELAARGGGVNDAPTLQMFAKVRFHIERAKRGENTR